METVIEIPVLALHMPFEFLCSEELPEELNFSFFKFALKGYLPYKIELFQLSVGRNLGFLWVSLDFASVIGPENLYHPLKVKTIMI